MPRKTRKIFSDLTEFVKYFISNQRNLCAQNTNCETPLYLALHHNRIEIVDIICEALSTHLIVSEECNVNKEIHLATEMGHLEIMKRLLLKRANPSVHFQSKEKAFECNKCFQYKITHKAIFIQHYKECLFKYKYMKKKRSK